MDTRIERYGRYWAVYAGNVLIAVCVYKKGAQSVADILNAVHQDIMNEDNMLISLAESVMNAA